MSMNGVGKLLPQKAVADELGCCVRTVVRRAAADPAFPRPVLIGTRYYFSEGQVEAYKRRLLLPQVLPQAGKISCSPRETT